MLPEYFEFLNPVKMLCGSGALENIPYELDRLGGPKSRWRWSAAPCWRRASSRGSRKAGGGDPERHPQRFLLLAGGQRRTARPGEGCDGVLAIGGGSVLDTAKAVRALLSQGERTLRAMLGSEWLTRGQPVPFVMVPTTSGTGSECTGVAVGAGRPQPSQAGDRLRPVSARRGGVGPAQHQKLPPRLTAASGMDALTHAIEAYTGRQKNPPLRRLREERGGADRPKPDRRGARTEEGRIPFGDGLRLRHGGDGLFQLDGGGGAH